MMHVVVQPRILRQAAEKNSNPVAASERVSLPAANIVAVESGWNIQIAAPGLTKESFQLKVEGRNLELRAAYPSTEADGQKRLRREFGEGVLSRTFQLPDTADTTAIQARYEAGVLTIHLPKKAPVKVEIA
ncbi:MAG: Hsp20/alpha crystallin family protein [Haliscomenobacter sp.]|nr:Hsp20/alpha crystallin family protein [Haliscomenobacter sp.]MBK8654730.1 Hsp20/alpha crystallin family protein [Haliscomenobacter sp.]MBP9077868.1 Hsp20/alpha crystallin family protein [Haliscomenobacter sp.]MBP9872508.1 Hsp20/alpha crystallin family protein [Haliscomenobacter sp.]